MVAHPSLNTVKLVEWLHIEVLEHESVVTHPCAGTAQYLHTKSLRAQGPEIPTTYKR